MTRLRLLAPLILAGCTLAAPTPEPAATGNPIASWGAFSGTVEPSFAWSTEVTFLDDASVTAEYCKGYASEPPGCATATARLAPEAYVALRATLEPGIADLAARPPRRSDEVNVGGGMQYGKVFHGGQSIELPSQPVAADAARVAQALRLLQDLTPQGLLSQAEARARNP